MPQDLLNQMLAERMRGGAGTMPPPPPPSTAARPVPAIPRPSAPAAIPRQPQGAYAQTPYEAGPVPTPRPMPTPATYDGLKQVWNALPPQQQMAIKRQFEIEHKTQLPRTRDAAALVAQWWSEQQGARDIEQDTANYKRLQEYEKARGLGVDIPISANKGLADTEQSMTSSYANEELGRGRAAATGRAELMAPLLQNTERERAGTQRSYQGRANAATQGLIGDENRKTALHPLDMKRAGFETDEAGSSAARERIGEDSDRLNLHVNRKTVPARIAAPGLANESQGALAGQRAASTETSQARTAQIKADTAAGKGGPSAADIDKRIDLLSELADTLDAQAEKLSGWFTSPEDQKEVEELKAKAAMHRERARQLMAMAGQIGPSPTPKPTPGAGSAYAPDPDDPDALDDEEFEDAEDPDDFDYWLRNQR